MQPLETFYKQRISTLESQEKALKKKDNRLAAIKLVLFFSAFFCLIKFYSADFRLALGLFGGILLLFIIAAFFHESLLDKLKRIRHLKDINSSELDMLGQRFSSLIDNGAVYSERDHTFSPDLDLFGENSLFHYVNRAVTAMGRLTLANMLKKPAPSDTVRQRQAAILELAEKVDFRQTLRSHGAGINDTPAKWAALREMMAAPYFLLEKKGFILFFRIFAILTAISLLLPFFGVPFEISTAMIAVQLAVNFRLKKQIYGIYKETAKNAAILKSYRRILADIENESFTAPLALEWQQSLKNVTMPASRQTARLTMLMEWFETRLSPALHLIVNNTVFFDLHCVLAIEKWKQENRSALSRWLAALAEFEALASLANVRFNNPNWVYPIIKDEGFFLEGKGMGHPLIPPDRLVANDVSLNHETGLLVITGPNMAGKSTFLRTVGVNIVLALAGAPVCASSMQLSPLILVTSMQSADSLDKQLSLFYAELQRLKLVLDTVRENKQVFFIIDEMLKGTNAVDRLKGAIALSRQLNRLGAIGIVATHDMGLTKLADTEPKVKNRHFDGAVENDRLLFDYKLKEGVCTSFNALALMRRMGIDV